MLRYAVLTVLLFLSSPAFALFKCQVNGKTLYSDAPCNQGKMTWVADHKAPSASDMATAQKDAAKREREAKELAASRHKEEAIEERERQRTAKAAAAKHNHCSKLALQKKWADEDASRATGKKTEVAYRHARRTGERYDLECKGI